MKKLFILLTLALGAVPAFAQDLITKKDGTAFAERTDKLLYAGDKVRYDVEEDRNVTVSRPLIDRIRNSDYCDTNGFVDYTFEDDYTLKVTVT